MRKDSLISLTGQTSFQDEKCSCLLLNKRVRRLRSLLHLASYISLICVVSLARVHAFTFISNPPTVWPDGNIPMDLQLGYAGDLIDRNTSWNTVAANALAAWNL